MNSDNKIYKNLDPSQITDRKSIFFNTNMSSNVREV